MTKLDKIGMLLAALLAVGGILGFVLSKSTQSSPPLFGPGLSSPQHFASLFIIRPGCPVGVDRFGCPPPSPEPKAWPVVTDTTTPGAFVQPDVLSTNNGSWVTSGDESGFPVTSFAYAWQRCNTAGQQCFGISSGSSSYTLTSADVGSTLRSVVTATNAGGSTSQASAPTPVIGGTSGGNTACGAGLGVNNPAGSTAAGATSDAIRANSIVPTSTGTVTALDAYLGSAGTGTQVLRAVLYNTNTSGQPNAPLAVSNELSISQTSTIGWYTLTFPTSVQLTAATTYWIGLTSGAASDLADYYTVANGANLDFRTGVTYTSGPPNPFGTASVTANEDMVLCGVYANSGSPVNTAVPVVSDATTPGAFVQGDKLSTTNGTWTPSAGVSFSYQWQDCNSSGTNCHVIAGANASTYTLQGSDVGDEVMAVVAATNSTGTTSQASATTPIISTSGGGGGGGGCTPFPGTAFVANLSGYSSTAAFLNAGSYPNYADLDACGYPSPNTAGSSGSLTTMTSGNAPSGTSFSGGDLSINANNANISNYLVNGFVSFSGAFTGIVFNNDDITCGCSSGNGVFDLGTSGSSVTVSHTTISGTYSGTPGSGGTCQTPSNMDTNSFNGVLTMTFDVVGCSDESVNDNGGNAVHLTVNNSYVIADGYQNGAHQEAFYLGGGINADLNNDTILGPLQPSGVIFQDEKCGEPSHATLTNSLLAGGPGNQVIAGFGGSNSTVTGNRFSPGWGNTTWDTSGPGVTWSGNYQDGTGATINPTIVTPGSC